MVDKKSLQELKIPDLKEVLKKMKLSTTGSKSDLVARILAADPDGYYLEQVCENMEEAAGTSDTSRAGISNDPAINADEGRLHLSEGISNYNASHELEFLRRERLLLQREIDLMRQENERVRITSPSTQEVEQSRKPLVNIKVISELLSEYNGVEQDFAKWEAQIRLLTDTYELTDNLVKILIGLRLKGKALEWFHSKPELISKTAADILNEIKVMYDHHPNKVDLRKQFEARTWQAGETFHDYYHEKTIKANRVPIPEEEILDYVIDGITDLHLRNQAKMHNFTSTEDLLQAFKKISIGPDVKNRAKTTSDKNEIKIKDVKSSIKEEARSKGGRCYNCNQTGHLFSECKRPRRERGSCYSCGEFGHIIKNCPKKNKMTETKEIGNVEISAEDHDFRRDVIYEISYPNVNYVLQLSTLLDTGSPISFIREQFVKHYDTNSIRQMQNNFCGINHSKLVVKGIINADITLDGIRKNNIPLLVVPDDTMSTCVLLGRDVLKLFQFKLSAGSSNEQVDEIGTIMNIDYGYSDTNILDICRTDEQLPFWAKTELSQIFEELYVSPTRPEVPDIKAELKLTLNNPEPFHFLPRRISYVERDQLRRILNELLDKKIIRSSESEYVSPVVLVTKKTGDLRMCVDYRALNKLLLRDNHPLPIIEDQLAILANKKYFSKLDLKDGFFHIDMAKESIKYTAFVTPLGHFEFLKMPFGLKVGPSRFQRFISEVFRDLTETGDLSIYMDDILIASETLEHHLDILKRVFQLLVRNKMELRLDKCEFLVTKIEYLGYAVTKDGISPTANGLTAVKNFSIPRNIHEVQSFLGLSSYFRKFVQDFAQIAKPLYELLKSKSTFCFGTKELESFERIKSKLTSFPVLAIYSPNDVTELHCDASAVGYGAILVQKKADLKFHPVFYFSKRTTPTESKYHSFELETLAVIYALRRFRHYLHGIKFKIVTDCDSFRLTLSKKDIHPRIARWALELQNYDYEIVHRAGSQMQHVDALSRITNIMVVEDNPLEFNLSVCQGEDPVIKELIITLDKSEDKFYEMRNGLVYRKHENDLLFYVPTMMEVKVIQKYHDEMGHLGADKTISTIKQSYWFPNLKRKVEDYIRNCLKCLSYSPTAGRREGLLHSINKGKLPFDIVHIDHYGPVDKRHKVKQYILTIIDGFTKYVKLYATKTTSSSEVIQCLTDYFRNYSRPRVIISDRGSSFTAQEFRKFLEENNIQQVLVATGSPQANGQAERVHRTLTPMLSKLTDDSSGNYWYRVLPDVEFALNNSINKSTGETPSTLLFGCKQRGNIVDPLADYMYDLKTVNDRNLDSVRADASMRIEKNQRRSELRTNKHRKPAHVYQIGDLVLIRNFDSTPGVSKKLIPQFKGPYKVNKCLRNNRYVISDVEGFQNTRRPYVGVWEAYNMRPWLKDERQ